MLFEEQARLLLVAHALFALATVALSTHLVFWLRPFLRGNFAGRQAVRRFALLSVGAYAATMLLGLALYPTYKVRVRAEYLENPSAITRAAEARASARALAEARDEESRRYRSGEAAIAIAPTTEDAEAVAVEAEERIEQAARLVRWFDVKEHWAALGLMMAAALALIMVRWHPDAKRKSITKLVVGLAVGAAATAWAAAIIGLVTAAARSVAQI